MEKNKQPKWKVYDAGFKECLKKINSIIEEERNKEGNENNSTLLTIKEKLKEIERK